MNPPTAAYPYDGPERLAERKPYSWSPFGGPPFLEAHRNSREAWSRALDDGDPEAEAMVERVRSLSGHAGPSGLEHSRLMDQELDALRQRWTVRGADEDVPVAELLDAVLRVLDARALPLRGDGAGTVWARQVVETLATRVESHGCVHARYDRRWKRTRPSPNPPEVVVRLALAVGWTAWSDLSTRPTLSLVHLNALLKLLDLASAGFMHGGWELSPTDRGRARAAAILERRLLRFWVQRVGGRRG